MEELKIKKYDLGYDFYCLLIPSFEEQNVVEIYASKKGYGIMEYQFSLNEQKDIEIILEKNKWVIMNSVCKKMRG